MTDKINILRPHDHHDQTDNELLEHAVESASENGHTIRRSATYEKDEVLQLGSADELRGGPAEYVACKTVGECYCSCGEHFGVDYEAARQHLLSVRAGGDDA